MWGIFQDPGGCLALQTMPSPVYAIYTYLIKFNIYIRHSRSIIANRTIVTIIKVK